TDVTSDAAAIATITLYDFFKIPPKDLGPKRFGLIVGRLYRADHLIYKSGSPVFYYDFFR
ncbi:MAG: hypothetical protein WCO74_05550, partial [Actinomycetes bacterium]